MIRAMEAIKRDVTYTQWYNWRAHPFEGPPDFSDSTCQCTAPSSHSHSAPSVWGLGQVHAGGAFPGRVFPSSSWNFQRATGPRHWTAARHPLLPREPQRSRRGSRKFLGFPVAAALARNRNPGPAPPARPRSTRSGGWGPRRWAGRFWAA